MLTSLVATVAVLLTEVSGVTVQDIMGILDGVTNTFSVSAIVAFIAGIIGLAITYVFLWWGARKGFKAIMGAVTRGELRIG